MKPSLLFRCVSIVALFCVHCCDVTYGQHGALVSIASASSGVVPKVILLAVEDGPPGEAALRAWSAYATEFSSELPPVWVLCRTPATEASVIQEPSLRPLVVYETPSWASILESFSTEHGSLVGLFGEGSLPHPGLAHSIKALGIPLSEIQVPAAVIPRSRSSGRGGGGGEWLPDTFVSQLWVNRAALEPFRLMNIGLDQKFVQDISLLSLLPEIVLKRPGDGMALIDGTDVLGSVFTVGEGAASSSVPVARDARGGSLYIGALGLAALHLKGGKHVAIVRAPWPPRYVLETVATSDGVVIVSNVNCGYLDMSTNFLLSVRKASGAKVLFVTMDEVSFNFMDELAPGSTVMFPVEPGKERKRASGAGQFGDPAFAAEVLVRPSILNHIMNQGFAVLWSDSDIVWLGNPLPLLPDTGDPHAAEVMLQHDGSESMTCTCFMFLKPTNMAHKLLLLWTKSIVDKRSTKNQHPFQDPLIFMKEAGLKVEYISDEVMPHGRAFFSEKYVEGYPEIVHPEAKIAHNNFIKGHEKKKDRFVRYHLWFVEGVYFPQCEG